LAERCLTGCKELDLTRLLVQIVAPDPDADFTLGAIADFALGVMFLAAFLLTRR
jgi:hypothetical protein